LRETKYLWRTTDGEVLYDGVTMLQILVETVKPSIRAGVADLKEKLRHSKLATFGYDVTKLTDKMESTYKEIIKQGQSHEDYLLDLFRALSTGNNEVFQRFISDEEGKYECGTDISPDELIQLATTRFNNMVAKKTWKTGESKDAKITALTTQLSNLEKKFGDKSNGKKSTKGNNESSSDAKKSGGRFDIDSWRLTKSLGASCEKEGKTWYWCHHQHNEGKGMYVTHKPDDHVSWKDKKKDKKTDSSSSNSKSNSSAKSSNGSTKKSLSLSDNLKATLVTKFKCSKEEAAAVWKQCCKEADDDSSVN
jgi:hypothetical protein